MRAAQVAYFFYAAALFGGGVMGFVKAGSRASILAGSLYALSALVAAFLMQKNPPAGLGLGIVTSLVVGGFFLLRFIEKHKFMPAGVTLLLSIMTLIVAAAALAGRR